MQITDLVISKLLRQNIEKYRALFPHVSAAIRLNISGVIANRGDSIQYVHTDSNHTDPLYRITPAKLLASEVYDREKYLEMLLDSAEAVCQYLNLIGHYLDLIRKSVTGGTNLTSSVRKILNHQKQSCKNIISERRYSHKRDRSIARFHREVAIRS